MMILSSIECRSVFWQEIAEALENKGFKTQFRGFDVAEHQGLIPLGIEQLET